VPVTPELTVVVTVVAVAELPVHEPDEPVVFWFSVGNVQLARFPDVGVPSTGVTNVGLVESTVFPEPVEVVTPVPPLATPSTPVKLDTTLDVTLM
jgi:hypothetical protein